jgi:GNAT superfamily N-acetyltransferase
LGRAASVPAITIRRFVAADEKDVLELLDATLGGGPAGRRPPGFFHWKHWQNPFGPSFVLVAESEGRLVGLRAFLRWRFDAAGRPFQAVRAVDTATHPDFQGMGVFSRLTLAALEALRDEVDLVFNTPNNASRPGYLKLGWQEVGRVPVAVRPRRPFRLLRGRRAPDGPTSPRPEVQAEAAAELLERTGNSATELFAMAHPPGDGRLRTPRTGEYLRWRYGAASLLNYTAVAEEETGQLRGLAIFRVRPRGGLWESTISELIVPPGDRRTARRLLHRVADAAPIDHLTLHVSDGAAPAIARLGFLPAPGGIGLVVKPLSDGIGLDPTDLRAWALSLGDLEVF